MQACSIRLAVQVPGNLNATGSCYGQGTVYHTYPCGDMRLNRQRDGLRSSRAKPRRKSAAISVAGESAKSLTRVAKTGLHVRSFQGFLALFILSVSDVAPFTRS